MIVTYVMDCMGCLHIWYGSMGKMTGLSSYPAMDDRDADIFVQGSQSVDAALSNLSSEDQKEVEEGWPVEGEWYE